MSRKSNKAKNYKKVVKQTEEIINSYPSKIRTGTLWKYFAVIVFFLLIGVFSFSFAQNLTLRNLPLSAISGRYSPPSAYALVFGFLGAIAVIIISKFKK